LEHSITVGNLVDGDTVYYSKDGATWAEEKPSYSDVGEYKVYVKVENPNYEDRTGLATVTITEKEVTITVDSKTKVYGTIDPTFTGTVVGLINENDLGEITFVRTNDDEEVGTYEGVLDANYTDNPNYKVEVIKGNFEITKAQGEELEVEGYTGVYDGLEHSITVGNLVDGDTVYYSKDGATW
ncbi:MBG domain-containing protein, partial [Vibrio parahaemolyticus]|nr:MBG domain-containing protein [Vibrio parahaemolyticus]